MDRLEGIKKRVGSWGIKQKQKRQKQKRQKQKNLPRINTELHGNKNKQKQKISHGKKTYLSEPDA